MNPSARGIACAFAGAVLAASALAVAGGMRPGPVTVQADGRKPATWRTVSAEEEARFHLGHAAYNTGWMPAGPDTGRLGGLGPKFNSFSCDACHNSRRRGRGPFGDGPAPNDFVVQAGQRLADGGLRRSHPQFGHVINTDAIEGFEPEAGVRIRYSEREHLRADGSRVRLWFPRYSVQMPGGQPPPDDLVVMPRMASQSQGVGMLESIPERAILAAAETSASGVPAWVDSAHGRRLGRFGWQATEPGVAEQVAVAFAREMGLTNRLIDSDDCAPHAAACRSTLR